MSNFHVVKPHNSSIWDAPYRREIIETDKDLVIRDGIPYLKVIKPKEWPKSMQFVPAIYFVQCDGPARPLNFEKYVRLVHSLLPKIPLPHGFESWCGNEEKKRN